jgi:ABC-type enterochelin transport system permease subunit
LTPGAEGALRHFLQDVVAADGFDDFFLGFLAFVLFIVGMLVALRNGSMLRSGMIAVGMFGARRVVGMGLIFERVLVVDMNIMCGFFAALRLGWRIRRRGG